MTTTTLVQATDTTTVAATITLTDTLVRCEHPGCPYAASKQMRIEQRLGEQRLRMCGPHAGVWAQRSAGRRGQTLTISDYPCPADPADEDREREPLG